MEDELWLDEYSAIWEHFVQGELPSIQHSRDRPWNWIDRSKYGVIRGNRFPLPAGEGGLAWARNHHLWRITLEVFHSRGPQ
jgi:hypothetical protein